jgi:hypothetical protein
MNRMTELQLEALLRKGTVTEHRDARSGTIKEIIHPETGLPLEIKAKMKQPRPKMTEEKMALHWALKAQCQKYGRPLFEEQRFHETRKWRLDYLIPGRTPVGIEYEGLLGGNMKTGHTESDRYTGNCDKYNAAALAGIVVLRYTHSNWGQAVADLEMFFL